jgi:hypothetical protein
MTTILLFAFYFLCFSFRFPIFYFFWIVYIFLIFYLLCLLHFFYYIPFYGFYSCCSRDYNIPYLTFHVYLESAFCQFAWNVGISPAYRVLYAVLSMVHITFIVVVCQNCQNEVPQTVVLKQQKFNRKALSHSSVSVGLSRSVPHVCHLVTSVGPEQWSCISVLRDFDSVFRIISTPTMWLGNESKSWQFYDSFSCGLLSAISPGVPLFIF